MYQRKDYESAVELVSTGKLQLDQIVTHRFAFKEYLKAYKAIEASGGKYMKVMLDL
jgi:threonine dehydrogenase-like Zn-dependent dehydrogenase